MHVGERQQRRQIGLRLQRQQVDARRKRRPAGQGSLDSMPARALAAQHEANRQRVRYGDKPLYLADDGTTLRVASQVKALLAGSGIDTKPDPAGHAGFFLFGYVPEPHTLHRGIRSLPAGSTLWLDADGKRQETCFFDVTSTLAEAEPAPYDLVALHEALAGSVASYESDETLRNPDRRAAR